MEADMGTICNSAEGEQGGTRRAPLPLPLFSSSLLPGGQKILQNNSKGAAKNIF